MANIRNRIDADAVVLVDEVENSKMFKIRWHSIQLEAMFIFLYFLHFLHRELSDKWVKYIDDISFLLHNLQILA